MLIDVSFDREREKKKLGLFDTRFFNVKSIDLRPSFSRSCASIKFLPRIHISDGKNWYAGRPFLDLFQLTESRNRRSGQNAFDGIYLENRTLTKAQTFIVGRTREIVKFSKACVRFRYTLTHRGFRAPLETSIPNENDAKISIPLFDFYTSDQRRLCIRQESSAVGGIFIESRVNRPRNLEDAWPNANRFHWNIPDKTCLLLSSREIYNLPHDLSR